MFSNLTDRKIRDKEHLQKTYLKAINFLTLWRMTIQNWQKNYVLISIFVLQFFRAFFYTYVEYTVFFHLRLVIPSIKIDNILSNDYINFMLVHSWICCMWLVGNVDLETTRKFVVRFPHGISLHVRWISNLDSLLLSPALLFILSINFADFIILSFLCRDARYGYRFVFVPLCVIWLIQMVIQWSSWWCE